MPIPLSNNRLQACCNEMDIWEANGRATGFTPHPCAVTSIEGCDSAESCGFDGVCDQWGCGFNSYSLGQPQYYGAGSNFVIDTTKKFTVSTRFVTDDGTTSGTLIDVQRSYMQEGRVITNAAANASSGWEGLTSITNVSTSVNLLSTTSD
jgi:cellulase